jgi:hypothetical protein
MSHSVSVPKAEKFDPKDGAFVKKICIGLGVVGLGVSGALFLIDKNLAAHVWLHGFFYFFTLLVGCLFWTCLHHATDAEWSVVVRRQLENLTGLLRNFPIFFIPIALLCVLSTGTLYEWMALPRTDAVLAGTKGLYLNMPFFWARVVAFFGLLAWVSHTLRSRSMAQDKDGAAKHTFTMRKFAVAGIPVLALSLTFAGIDWLKALNHHWYSTMWGVYLFAGAAGASMALLVLVVTWLKSKGYLKPVNDEHYHLMGKFLLAFTIFWAYIGFSQYMLITYANIEEETIFFRLRNTGGWNYLSMFLVFGRFFFMFVPLLFQGIKKSTKINFCAAWILFMQFVDLFIIIIPEYTGAGGFSFKALIASVFPLMGIGGVLGYFFLKNLAAGYVFPTKDPRLAESLKFSN